MSERIQLSYFYGKEAEQFSFYKIPKLLFTDEYFKKLSVEAKVLYGLMLDRMSLSVKNQWLDEEGKAYIYYSVEDIMESLSCSNNKAIAVLKELDAGTGIGLVERRRQGQGKPSIIYVKQFMVQDFQKCSFPISEEKDNVSEMEKINVLKCNNSISRSAISPCQEVGKMHSNKNNINNTEMNYTKSNHILSDADRRGCDVNGYAELIRDNIDLDILKERYPYEKELLEGIYDLILETVLCENDSIVVASNKYSTELVKHKLLKLNSSHIEYVMDCMRKNTSKVRNIKKYLLTTLFNAPSTISSYYQSEVNYDMPQLAMKR